ncbi:hypothetical protein RhiirB3_447728 [Rhizophagus irregularis]|nr:hypothetical protein RhiirB3_447728 [Rhizophagus irregularis]
MALIFHHGLLKDFTLILDDADDYNVIIQVGENQNIKEFRAHSVILRARSLYFKSALSSNWVTKKDNMIIFSKPNLTPIIFDMVLRYIYTGELDLTEQSGENILNLLVASDELLLEELFIHVQNYLIIKQTNWVRENFVFVLNTVFRLDNCKRLQDYCLESICEDPLQFFSSKSFLSINKEILLGLLKRDDLQIEEVVIWEWGIEQTPGLGYENSDRAKWNYKDYETLNITLNQFIPLIQLAGISRADFFDKVHPYRTIIPTHIYKEIEEFHYKDSLPKTTILPTRAGLIFKSNIIKPKLAKIIINWIDNKDTMYIRNNRNDPFYKFNLIYRSSRDGIGSKSFKKKCNGRVASLVLIKVKNISKIFGGYSSIGFNSSGDDFINDNGFKFYNSSDNFIFSFEDGEDTQNMKISRVINSSHAILDYYHNGFNFGQGSLSMSYEGLHVNNTCSNYENNLNTLTVYTIEEIETFTLGELDLTEQSGENILNLLVASDELLLEELFIHVQNYLIIKQTNWVRENFVFVLNTVFRLDNCKRLQDYCLESICEDPLQFFSSKSFLSINKEILLGLLKRDDLQIEEVVIWEWGIEQTPGLGYENSDRAKWNYKDYETLNITLNQFIPLIQLAGISRADFFDKVHPYRTIIPTHIYKEIEEFHYKDSLPKTTILPTRAGLIFKSNIIKPKLAKIIINWIDNKDTMYIRNNRNDPFYKFNLIYRSSRDGIGSKSFKKKCNGRVASLVLIKVKNISKIFGGYSSIGFNSSGDDFINDNGFKFYNSSDNFIFSFEDGEDTQNMKISRVINSSHAILDYYHNGFNFGQGSLSMSYEGLHVNNTCSNYENNLNTLTVYTIEEIETFTVNR